jgi:hypothetical protein
MMILKWFISPSMFSYTAAFGGRMKRGSSS